jgi:predicted secreted hydrolase
MKKRISASFHFWPLLLILVLTSCGVPGVPTTAAQLPLVNAAPSAQALPPVRFPQDEAPHRDLTEWWYYTGHLNAVTPDGQQQHYGFELVFFQTLRSDLPPFYIAHFAISDLARNEFHYDQRRLTEPNAVIPNGTSSAGFNVGVNDWSAQGLNGKDHLEATMHDYTIKLDLNALKPLALHNGKGLITDGLGNSSYYYSRTRMSVTGTLLDHQQSLQVNGEAWMDHQWGDFVSWGDNSWDWFSIQLNDQTEMMIYLSRNTDGNVSSTYIDFMESDAQNIQLPARSLHISVLNHWTSPTTGITYPSGWQVEINDPHLQTILTLQPELQNQELVKTQSTDNTYWEGAVSIQSQSGDNTVQGEGYVELTGYHK